MSSLKDTADQLLIDVDSPDCRATRETLHLIAKKSSSLLQKCNDNLELLETKVDPSQFQLDRVGLSSSQISLIQIYMTCQNLMFLYLRYKVP